MKENSPNHLKLDLRSSRHSSLLLFLALCLMTKFSFAAESNKDPLEGLNRSVDAFNNTIDRMILLPAAKTWQAVIPRPVDDGVSNMFRNLEGIIVITNDFLQGKISQGFSDTIRLLVNTTIGIGGFFDPASTMGLDAHDEDFGQTLGYWNVPPGPYLVLPFFGASTLRDSIGLFPESALNPLLKIEHIPTRNTLVAAQFVDTRADLISLERAISGDRYIFIRNGYLQRRQFLVNDGAMDDDFPDEDFDDFDEVDAQP